MTPDSDNPLRKLIGRHRAGDPIGIYSVCSASHWVLRAAMARALQDNSLLLIEATCNQVNQFGGYTGRTPLQFADDLRILAEKYGFPLNQLILGGDHLGPSVWQNESSDAAMKKSRDLVRRYVEAGFTKIHLDTSMSCQDDPVPLPEEVVAKRSADLCSIAESTHRGSNPLLYIIGTEVPTPGGALEDLDGLQVTQPEDVRNTIEMTFSAFRDQALESALQKIIGVVVQPGVEFGSETIIDYDPKKAAELSRAIEDYPDLVYEAHSTDYQRRQKLREMVRDHFCILKVGPALTFAFRESIFALAAIEKELSPIFESILPSEILETLDRTMMHHPSDWKKHYSSRVSRQAFERKFSFSDRIRYYWQYPEVRESLGRLLTNLDQIEIPLSLLSQYLPDGFEAVREGRIENRSEHLILHRIQNVLDDYSYACGESSIPNLEGPFHRD